MIDNCFFGIVWIYKFQRIIKWFNFNLCKLEYIVGLVYEFIEKSNYQNKFYIVKFVQLNMKFYKQFKMVVEFCLEQI